MKRFDVVFIGLTMAIFFGLFYAMDALGRQKCTEVRQSIYVGACEGSLGTTTVTRCANSSIKSGACGSGKVVNSYGPCTCTPKQDHLHSYIVCDPATVYNSSCSGFTGGATTCECTLHGSYAELDCPSVGRTGCIPDATGTSCVSSPTPQTPVPCTGKYLSGSC